MRETTINLYFLNWNLYIFIEIKSTLFAILTMFEVLYNKKKIEKHKIIGKYRKNLRRYMKIN